MSARTDFAAYRRWWRETSCLCPHAVDQHIRADQNGVNALQAYIEAENGQVLPCREPEVLRQALEGKASVNLQITLWAEGINAGLFALWEFEEDYPWLPDWVWRAVCGQTGGAKCKFGWHYRTLVYPADHGIDERIGHATV